MKFLFEKKFEFSKLTEFEHTYLNYVVYIDHLYSTKKDDDDNDEPLDLGLDWVGILVSNDTEVTTDEFVKTELEKRYDLYKGISFMEELREGKGRNSRDMYHILRDTYCVHPNDFDVKEVMTMFGVVFHLMNKEMERESLTAIG